MSRLMKSHTHLRPNEVLFAIEDKQRFVYSEECGAYMQSD